MTSAELAISGFRSDQPIALPELISALTFALDLTETAVPGHGLRCCLLGMRLGRALDLPEEQLTSLYYALQLKDIGCSSNAARMTQVVGGDDRIVKGAAKLSDWTSILRASDLRTFQNLWACVLPESPLHSRIARIASLGLHRKQNNREMIELRCERGSEIVRKLKMGETAADAVLCLDEHWNGAGYPDGLRGEAIPLASRICAIAQNLDLFATTDGRDQAIAVLRRRSGRWFDPHLVHLAARLHECHELWKDVLQDESLDETRRRVMDMEPRSSDPLLPQHVDTICEGFADVVDAKSPFTYRHSLHVADVAQKLAETMQFPLERRKMLWRTALLHDLGKLSVPNTILDKHGSLTEKEWSVIREHPSLSQSILERITAFGEMAVLAAEHHEKLDGSGYPRGLTARDLTLESRILALADQFAGMTEIRPYHAGYTPHEALELIWQRVPTGLDPVCFEALAAMIGGTCPQPPQATFGALREDISTAGIEVVCG